MIDSTNNTLTGVMNSVNSANAGVTASIQNQDGKFILVFTADKEGTTNAFSMTGIPELEYNLTDTASSPMATIKAAQDSKFMVDSVSYTRPTNSVSDVLTGVTIEIKEETKEGSTNFYIKPDTEDFSKKINSFISSYNALINLVSEETKFDPKTKAAGDLNGDSNVIRIKSQLRETISKAFPGGDLSRLYEIGIKTNVDGTLVVNNEAKLNSALSNQTKDVVKLFGGSAETSGLADEIYSKVHEYLTADGVVSKRTESINESIAKINKKIDVLNGRMDTIEATYRRKFSSLDTLMSSLNKTSEYLTRALNSDKSKTS